MRVFFSITAVSLAIAGSASAQTSSFGQSWSTAWGFTSPTERSIRNQQAQSIYNVENSVSPQYTYNTYYDYRNNYVENSASGSTITADQQIGDNMGDQTYSVGSLNTGSTNITAEGDGNIISATNSSESNGCVDGSLTSVDTTFGVVATTDQEIDPLLKLQFLTGDPLVIEALSGCQ